MEKLKHWTTRSQNDFVHAIASDFVAQIETTMEEENMDRKSLATKAHVSPGRVSQVLNNPSSLNLRSMVKYARAVKRKVAIVTYDDGDPGNKQGPIDAGVFTASWQQTGCPRDLFELQGMKNSTVTAEVSIGQRPYMTDEYFNSAAVASTKGPTLYGLQTRYDSITVTAVASTMTTFASTKNLSYIGSKYRNFKHSQIQSNRCYMAKRESDVNQKTAIENASPKQDQVAVAFVQAPDFKTIYTNFVNATFSPLDIFMVVGEVIGPAPDGKSIVLQRAKIIMAPVEAKIVTDVLVQTVAQYEKQFGKIAVPKELMPPKVESD